MSYARFGSGGSDVYVFLNARGFLDCCSCILQEREWVYNEDSFLGYWEDVEPIIQNQFKTTQEMLDHLRIHQEAGDLICQDTIDELIEDQEENDQWIVEYNESRKDSSQT